MAAVVVVIVVGLLLFVLLTVFSAANRRKRLMAATPRTLVAHATGGVTKIQGQLGYCWPPLQAPISGRPCAVYEVKVLTYENQKEELLLHEIQGQPFLIHDESGRALVSYDPQTVVLLRRDVKDTSRAMKDPTPLMAALLQRHGVPATRIFGLNRGLIYQEAVLEAGELITAFGVAHREPDPDPAAAHAAGCPDPSTWTVIHAAPGMDLTLTDELPFDQRSGPPPGAPPPGAPYGVPPPPGMPPPGMPPPPGAPPR